MGKAMIVKLFKNIFGRKRESLNVATICYTDILKRTSPQCVLREKQKINKGELALGRYMAN
jgi:hypothetical protein